MATFVPFAILRLIPAVEAGAVAHLDGLRARGTTAATRLPRSAASHALHEGLGALGDARLLAQTPAGRAAGGTMPGAETGPEGAETPGAGGAARNEAVELGEGDPASARRFDELVARGVTPARKGPKPILGTGSAPPDGTGQSGGGAEGEATAEGTPVARAHSRTSSTRRRPARPPPRTRGSGRASHRAAA